MPKKKLPLIVAQVESAPTGEDSEIASLTALELHSGWQIILRILNENIKILENCILERIDVENHPLTDKELDELRFKRGIYKEVIDTPKNYIKVLIGTQEEPEVETDPYHKNIKSMLIKN